MTGSSSFNCLLLITKRSIHGSSNSGRFLKIGNAQVPIRSAKNVELVPQSFASADLVTREVGNLKWLIQKDILKQDVYLIGPPGEAKSTLALAYTELTNREVEYLLLTRDSTESDIKQRREIRSSNAYYSDLAAVKAALNGRVLIIDGVEKAERNVLPILNNLLENREMQLDDGRFLMAATKYDKLLEKYSKEELDNMKLERVHEDFNVIALGLPVPNFKGHSLDPPLRSRFQCVNIGHLPFGIAKQFCETVALNVDKAKLEKLICLVYGINLQHEQESLGLIRVPIDNLVRAVNVWNKNPQLSEAEVFSLIYPDKTILKRETEQSTLEEFFKNFKIQPLDQSKHSKITKIDCQQNGVANVQLDYDGKTVDLTTQCGNETKHSHFHKFVSTEGFETFLSQLALTHSASDFCILGEKGSGKSVIISEFAKRFGYSTETIALYNDLNSRDLLQSRRILENGDTVWEDGQLVKSLKEGKLVVLDNLEQAHWSTIEVLSTLIHHRFLQLPDGTRLISQPAFEMLKSNSQYTADELNKRGIYQISPNFRLVALGDAESANASGPTAKWLNDQMLSLFLFHTLPTMDAKEEMDLINKLVPNADKKTAKKLIDLVHKLMDSHDSKLRNVALSLSLRRQIAILKRHACNKKEGIYEAIYRATLARFLPNTTRSALLKCMEDFGITPIHEDGSIDSKSLKKQLETISRNDLSLESEALIPEIVFFDNNQHIKVISDMAKDFELGSHLLLIGNQGVGKNKITDRFLQLVKRPRQYIQLHRDTTIQSLTVRTTVVDGILRYEDSPLIKAVRDGQVLVIDEADKAPLNVIAVLKSLLDSGFLYLSDGRRIQPAELDPLPNGKSIAIHPDFRIIMLANRPGFPFLGNDLFGTLGDLFSVHIIDNPDRDSETAMLKQYGPNVNDKTIQKLIKAFNELRELSNEGQLQYPFSTRELVAIVKHLQRFPEDNVSDATRNVFDFDAYSNDTLKTIDEVFKSNKIPIELGQIYTTKERLEIQGGEHDFDLSKLGDPKYGKVDPNNTPHTGGNTWAGGTGGWNTAGLGGAGGPFRLDAGHNVTQISELAKQQVPEEIRKKARAIAQQEYAKRLKEIDMTPYDGKVYKEFSDKIAKQVGLLKNIVDSLEAREKERRWAKHQTSGDIDEQKIVESISGEKAIYRKRVELEPEPGTTQKKPKLLTLLVDVSGSMYRFNGYDQRLHKSLETALLVMESLHGKGEKIKYNLVGHSGETFEANFSSADKPPANEKDRLSILKKMLAHSQFCMSGDYTLEAIEVATKKLSKEENADERFLITLSDANLDRYGIQPKHLANVLDLEKNVNSYLILIGSLGPQAERLRQALPAGKAFIAQNTAEIPKIMSEIFTTMI